MAGHTETPPSLDNCLAFCPAKYLYGATEDMLAAICTARGCQGPVVKEQIIDVATDLEQPEITIARTIIECGVSPTDQISYQPNLGVDVDPENQPWLDEDAKVIENVVTQEELRLRPRNPMEWGQN